MSDYKPENPSAHAEKPGRSSIIERLRLRRRSWGDRQFDDSAELMRRMRDRRVAWRGERGSPDGGDGSE